MTDYKLVPVEGLRYTFDGALAECPCCGSLDVGGAHDTVHCQSCGLTVTKPRPLQNAIDAWNARTGRTRSAAPAVQGEPVAVMYEDGSLLSKADCGENFEICCKVQTPLYAAPQPTQQQPTISDEIPARTTFGGLQKFTVAEQHPVAEVKYGGYASGNELVWAKGAGLQFLPEGTKLYAASIHVPTPVAYLDVGAGGYMDLGTDLTEDQVGSFPWGRHILAIVGTYGADGYVPAEQQPAPDVAGLVEAAEAALEEIENIMHEAYNSAYPVCCGRAGSECCGSPDPEWDEADQRLMDRLDPHQKALRAALAAHRKQGGEA